MDSKKSRFNPDGLFIDVQRMTTNGEPIVSPQEVIGLSPDLFQKTSGAESLRNILGLPTDYGNIPLTESGSVNWSEGSAEDIIKDIEAAVEKFRPAKQERREQLAENEFGFLGDSFDRRLGRLSLDQIIEFAKLDADHPTVEQQSIQRIAQAELAERIAQDKAFNDVMRSHRERLEELGIPARKLFGIEGMAQEDAEKTRIYSGGRGVGKSFSIEYHKQMVKQLEYLLERTYKGYHSKSRRIQERLLKKLLNKHPQFKPYAGNL